MNNQNLISAVELLKERLTFQIKLIKILNPSQNVIETLSECEKLLKDMITFTKEKTNIKENYENQIVNDINQLAYALPYNDQHNFYVNDKSEQPRFREGLNNSFNNIKNCLDNLKFNIRFFQQINFFEHNIVGVGANGSGKTTLCNLLKKFSSGNVSIVSAQKVLNIPSVNSISNLQKINKEFKRYQTQDKTYKSDKTYGYLNSEFSILLQILFAEYARENNNFHKIALEKKKLKEEIPSPEIGNLDRAFSIWNNLISHRKIDTIDGIEIRVSTMSDDYYSAIQMSDGEKVILYYIAHVLLTPKSGFVIVDEPEMFLHKSITVKLWDMLELERDDCIFIYLTHDLEFASSRVDAKKIWIKKYIPPERWEIVEIPENEIPDSLMMELLGSRKNILFCEGDSNSIDIKIYNVLLTNLTIVPVVDCKQVISYTRAFNKLKFGNTIAFGLIDLDFSEKYDMVKLESENVYNLKVAEPENLFLDENFLKQINNQLLTGRDSEIEINEIKESIITLLEKEKEIQISNYLSSKINNLFQSTHVKKGNNRNEVESNLKDFQKEIDIEGWYNERKKLLEGLILNKNYTGIVTIFNNKGSFQQILNQKYSVRDFNNKSLNFLRMNYEAKNALRKYLPEELVKVNNSSK